MKKLSKKIIGMTLLITLLFSTSIVIAENTINFQIEKQSEVYPIESALIYGQVFGIQHSNNRSISAIPLENAMVIITKYQGVLSEIINEDGTLKNISLIPRPDIPRVVFTNDKGEFRCKIFMHFGNFKIIAVKDGYAREIKGPFNVKEGDKLNVDFILEPKIPDPELGWLHGKVRQIFPGYRTMPRPLAGVRITAIRMMPHVNVSPSLQTITGVTYTQEDGSYKLRLRPGIYMILASKEGYSSEKVLGVLIVSGEGTEKNFYLKKIDLKPEFGWLTGRVLGEKTSGNLSALYPLSGVKIIAISMVTGVTYSREDGSYKLRLKPGKYMIRASKEGYSSYVKTEVVIVSGKHTEENFVLKKMIQEPILGWLHGRVLGETSSGNISALYPLSGVRITAVPMAFHCNLSTIEQGEIYVTYTKADGSYNLWLRPGTYMVTASKNGYSSYIKTNVVIVKGEGTEENFVLKKFNITFVPISELKPITIKPIKASCQIMMEKIELSTPMFLTEKTVDIFNIFFSYFFVRKSSNKVYINSVTNIKLVKKYGRNLL